MTTDPARAFLDDLDATARVYTVDDAALIAAAVNALPALTAALRAVLNLADAWQELEPGVDPEEALLDQVGADIWAAVTAALTPKPTP